ncbi:MAG: hypothetical protein QOG06_1971 [Gaiellaceae bacterium]|jgi:ligand-binding SRPBCC domain-containing protein|nr:hypothetical protein [Gaiellaceae bacterium]MDX6507327.1 hypothetical protein [Gaiellaceae bacterium]
MTKIERSIVIDRPVEEVWEFVHETADNILWQTTLAESEQLTEGPMDVGTRVREVRRFLGLRIESTWEMTEYEPNRTSAIRVSPARSRSTAAIASRRSKAGRGSP